ncbi:hypothetical protein ATC00_23995 [Sinorhizobium americanum]|nr:hypothetical protein ATC00_23995 [Sinorhizobium americanum]
MRSSDRARKTGGNKRIVNIALTYIDLRLYGAAFTDRLPLIERALTIRSIVEIRGRRSPGIP